MKIKHCRRRLSIACLLVVTAIAGGEERSGVLFDDGFEQGWEKWRSPRADTRSLTIENDPSLARSGRAYLRSAVDLGLLRLKRRHASVARHVFEKPVDEIYLRFYFRLDAASVNPHHWIRLAATDGSYDIRGKANTRPEGDEAAWITLDIDKRDRLSFYLYWHEMRSGRCNDGSTEAGCEGDQGHTYFYGNTFRPAGQRPLPREQWLCLELNARLNQPGQHDGRLVLWLDDEKIGEFSRGVPEGTWLRKNFHPGGCRFRACSPPAPFEGFSFRSSERVRFRELYLDAYHELKHFREKMHWRRQQGLPVAETSVILYDDIVLATQRIGCRDD